MESNDDSADAGRESERGVIARDVRQSQYPLGIIYLTSQSVKCLKQESYHKSIGDYLLDTP